MLMNAALKAGYVLPSNRTAHRMGLARASRTDKGVHALGNVFSLKVELKKEQVTINVLAIIAIVAITAKKIIVHWHLHQYCYCFIIITIIAIVTSSPSSPSFPKLSLPSLHTTIAINTTPMHTKNHHYHHCHQLCGDVIG